MCRVILVKISTEENLPRIVRKESVIKINICVCVSHEVCIRFFREEWICKTCSENGAQLLCHSCETYQHLSCVVPPMRKVPKSKWFCHECRQLNAAAMQKESQKDTSINIVENGGSPPTTPKVEDLDNVNGGSPVQSAERTPRSGRKPAVAKIEQPSNHIVEGEYC